MLFEASNVLYPLPCVKDYCQLEPSLPFFWLPSVQSSALTSAITLLQRRNNLAQAFLQSLYALRYHQLNLRWQPSIKAYLLKIVRA